MFWTLSLVFLVAAALLTLWPLVAGPPKWKAAAGLLILAIPAGSALLYQHVGTPAALDPGNRQPLDLTGADMADLTDRLRQRLTESPESLEGWVLLGRTYKTLQRYDEALEALETANRLAPDHPIVLVELVEARLFASGNPRMTGDMVELLEHAVSEEPGLQKGYWLLGIAAAQRGDDRSAIAWWENLLQHTEPGGGVAETVTVQIAEARARLGEAPADPPVSAPPGHLAVEVTLAESAREALGNLPPQAALFVIVRAAGDAGGPPLGVRRIERPEFPLALTLSDADSMLPQRPISTAGELEIHARLSLAGQPTAAAGDWQSGTAAAGTAEPTRLQLDQFLE